MSLTFTAEDIKTIIPGITTHGFVDMAAEVAYINEEKILQQGFLTNARSLFENWGKFAGADTPQLLNSLGELERLIAVLKAKASPIPKGPGEEITLTHRQIYNLFYKGDRVEGYEFVTKDQNLGMQNVRGVIQRWSDGKLFAIDLEEGEVHSDFHSTKKESINSRLHTLREVYEIQASVTEHSYLSVTQEPIEMGEVKRHIKIGEASSAVAQSTDYTPSKLTDSDWRPIDTVPQIHMFRCLICGGTLGGVAIADFSSPFKGEWETFGWFGAETHRPAWWQPLPPVKIEEWMKDPATHPIEDSAPDTEHGFDTYL